MRGFFGFVFVAAGLTGLPIVHYYRPPSSALDALGILASGRPVYLSEPQFWVVLAVCATTAAIGAVLLFARRRR
jgi:hypothetical protein